MTGCVADRRERVQEDETTDAVRANISRFNAIKPCTRHEEVE
jgi:hypothetical protein